MPRVSPEHLERRRQQILDAARTCFIREGVHATSMQDIFAEAGLSAGAVYRYFKSKTEIIEAITGTVIGDLHTFLGELVQHDPVLPLDELVVRVAERVVALSGPDGTMRLAPQAWALAMYDPDLRRYVQQNVVGLRVHWAEYARRCVAAGLLPPDTDPVAAGKAIFGIIPGFLLQRLILDDASPEELRAGVRAMARESLLAAGATTDPVQGA
ncbi:TetR/AcrR family transcriptional regulator [Spirillospora sp. NPDC029432]|uniref:TetR/AcrR family transcriptional regulator n=1 Tax=Spirillospora sp. NPDC029432 TaxID=3154599 RepID=UPI0034553B68